MKNEYSSLPAEFYPSTSKETKNEKLMTFLQNVFRQEKVQLKDTLSDLDVKSFHLRKIKKERNPRPKPHRQKRLTFRQRRQLKLNKINRNDVMYEDMLALHDLWQQYVRNVLKLGSLRKSGWNNDPSDSCFQEISLKLYRIDLHGCLITVKSSSCPSLVGLTGIVIMETKNVFKIVSKENIVRTVPKATCEFGYKIDEFEMHFNGQNFLTRSAERSCKKVKSIKLSNVT